MCIKVLTADPARPPCWLETPQAKTQLRPSAHFTCTLKTETDEDERLESAPCANVVGNESFSIFKLNNISACFPPHSVQFAVQVFEHFSTAYVDAMESAILNAPS